MAAERNKFKSTTKRASIQSTVKTGGASGVVSLVAGTPAATILGTEAAVTAVMIGVAGGGIGILKKLRRDYRIATGKDGRIVVYLKK